jgi:DNA ligase-1
LNEEALITLYTQFEYLKNCTKKQDKINCLKEYRDDTLFTYVLEFLINTHKKTGISNSKLNKDLSNKDIRIKYAESLQELIEYVIINNSGTDEDILVAQCFINNLSNVTLQRFISELITKKYKCGVTAKFVGEVLPNLIKVEHQVMLANKFKGELKESAYVSLKLDGIRCSALVNDDDIKFLTRQGKEIHGLNQIANAIKLMDLKGYMLDGELLRINNDNLPSEENFKETTSIVNSKSDNKEGLEFVIFDIVPLTDYMAQNNNIPYSKRFDQLNKLVKTSDYIRLVPFYGITDNVEKIYEILNTVTSAGEEGLMLNLASGVYKFGKRSSELLKVKAMHTCDLKCIDVQEGEGKYANTLGRIICLYKGHILKVGSGFSDEQRNYYWKHKNEIKLKIVEVQYFEESSNEQGGLSLRFPVFKRVRDDKDEESYE